MLLLCFLMPQYINWYSNRVTEKLRFNIQQRQEIFLFFEVSRLTLGSTQSLIQHTPGGKLFLHDYSSWGWEACHSSLYSAKVKNAWNYTSTLPHTFSRSCLIQHRTNSQLIYMLTFILMFIV